MKAFLKVRVLLPILLGWALGGLLFMLGDADDAPGLSFIGLSVAFLLSMRGIYCAGVLPQGYCLPIILLAFGAAAVLMPVVLLLDGELEGIEYLALTGEGTGLLLLLLGGWQLWNRKRKQKRRP